MCTSFDVHMHYMPKSILFVHTYIIEDNALMWFLDTPTPNITPGVDRSLLIVYLYLAEWSPMGLRAPALDPSQDQCM